MKKSLVVLLGLLAAISTSVIADDNVGSTFGWAGQERANSAAGVVEAGVDIAVDAADPTTGKATESVAPTTSAVEESAAVGAGNGESVDVVEVSVDATTSTTKESADPVATATEESVDTAVAATEESAVRETLARIIPNRKPDIVEETPFKGLYEVVYGSDIFYLSEDGRYLIQGDMVDLNTQDNLTEGRRTGGRLKLMEKVSLASKIRFTPKAGKAEHVVDVFTDVDCFYCQKLHNEMDTYLKEGIEIRYLAFPRAGVNSRSYQKIVSVWCAGDQQSEMTLAKNKQVPKERSCENPVQAHMDLGREVGVSGTPAMVFEDGSLVPGYVPAPQLKKMLDERFADSK